MSTEFLGEVVRSAKRLGARRGRPTTKPLTQVPPRASSKHVVRPARESQRPDLSQLMTDFKAGVSRLGYLAQRLSASGYKAAPPQVTESRRAPQDVTKIIERELRTISQIAPAAVQHDVVREYRELAEQASALQIPQAHAAILQGSKRVPPAEALRPTSKAVRSLMQAAQAIKQGRLPFLPKETRREAQKLLSAVFSKQSAVQLARSNQIPRAIESQRLIPGAVHGMMEATRAKNQPEPQLLKLIRQAAAAPLADLHGAYRAPAVAAIGAASQRLPAVAAIGAASQRVPVAAHDLPRLSKAIPAFDTQGAATGGAYLSHAGEDVQVITRSDSPLATPGDTGGRSDGEGPVPAPQASSSRKPMSPAAGPGRASTGVSALAAADTGGKSNGPVRIEGTLNIPELGNIVSKFTGFMTDNGALT